MPLLQIDIEARYAKFQDALTSIERQTKASAANMSKAFDGVKGTLAGLGVAVSVGAFVELVKNAIDTADHLNDLSKKTGIAVGTLGGLGFAAKQAGGDLDSVAAAAGKLNKSIAEAAGGSKEIGVAFTALGINIKDANGQLKTADVVIAEVADKFAGYADGPEKAAIALRLFGKAGADIIPLLDDGGKALRDNIAYYEKYAGITTEVAQKADAFNDTLEKLHLLSGAVGRSIAAELLDPLQAVADAMLDAKEKSNAFATIGKTVGTAFEALVVLGANVAFTFHAVGTEIGGIAAQLNALAHGDFKGFTAIGDAMKADAAKARSDLDAFEDRILNRKPTGTAAESPTTPDKPKPRAPILPATGASGDPAWKLLEGQLNALERMSEKEREILASRNEFLQTYYQDDLISIRDYFSARRASQEDALREQSANIDKEIANLKRFKPKDEQQKAEVNNKVEALQDKKAALQTGAQKAAILLSVEETRAAKAFQDTLTGINADLLEQQGLLAQAAGIRFDLSNDKVKTRLTTERTAAVEAKDPGTVAARDADLAHLATLREAVISQAKLNSINEVGARIQFDLTEATDRAQISVQTGATTELESLRAVSDARLQAVADLQQVATAFDAVARASGDPKIVQQARALQLEVDKLAASADLVREKFEDAFTGPFESALEKLASGTASLKDALKGLFTGFAAEITKMGAHDLSKQLFGQAGPLGGAVDFVSGLFGGKPKVPTSSADVAGVLAKATGGAADTAAATAATAALTTLATSTTAADAAMLTISATVPVADAGLSSMGATSLVADGALTTLAASASAAAAALSTVAATGSGSSASGLLGLFGGSGVGSSASYAELDLLASANGNIFAGGNVIPFAKGGVQGIVSAPTFFPMKNGSTGVMGEAGPEAIMPLARDKGGELAVRMVGARGNVTLLPVTRDNQGRMAVRAAKAFADGGVFGAGASVRRFAAGAVIEGRANQVMGFNSEMVTQAAPAGKGGDTHLVVQVTPPAGSSSASAQQWGATAGRQIQSAMRRNT